jgi:3-deoxy-7-phosphoheptulonate synthase
MIVILEPNISNQSEKYNKIVAFLANLPKIKYRIHEVQGQEQRLTEIYLIGDTRSLSIEQIQILPGVESVVRVSQPYRILGRHARDDKRSSSFEYNGVIFSQDNLHVFAGLCAVDNPKKCRNHDESIV